MRRRVAACAPADFRWTDAAGEIRGQHPQLRVPTRARSAPVGYGTRPMRMTSIAVLLVAFGCGKSTAAQQLRVSMIPTTDPGKATREMEPLAQYLSKKTGTTVQITVPTNYAAVVEVLINDQVDVAFLGGFTYVQASKR